VREARWPRRKAVSTRQRFGQLAYGGKDRATDNGPEPVWPAEYPPATQIPRAPVTENPVVGSFVRAMQKSGVPDRGPPKPSAQRQLPRKSLSRPVGGSDRRPGEELKTSEKAAGAVNTRFDIATRSGIGLVRVSILLILQVP
jgi:hypothetical protein